MSLAIYAANLSHRQLHLAIARLGAARAAARKRNDLGAELTLMGILNFFQDEQAARDAYALGAFAVDEQGRGPLGIQE